MLIVNVRFISTVQKSQKGDPMALMKKQLEEKERALQEGMLQLITLTVTANASQGWEFSSVS